MERKNRFKACGRNRKSKSEDSTGQTNDFGHYKNGSFESTPAGRFFTQFFDEAMRYFGNPFRNVAPYWMEQPIMRECNIGNTGKVTDNDERFSIEMDVSQFQINELSVNLKEKERELIVEGNQKEHSDSTGSIERHFKRKFTVPLGTNVDVMVAHITRKGWLIITAPKKLTEPPPIRNIPIVPLPDDEEGEQSEQEMKENERVPQRSNDDPKSPRREGDRPKTSLIFQPMQTNAKCRVYDIKL